MKLAAGINTSISNAIALLDSMNADICVDGPEGTGIPGEAHR